MSQEQERRRPNIVRGGLLPGVAGGLAGGLVFGGAMLDLGLLPSVAAIIRLDSPYLGFVVHMTIAATVGAGLGIVVWRIETGVGETVLWGMIYGTLWWFIGTLTLHPLFLGNVIDWSADGARVGFPAFLGHVLYGASAGLVIALLRRQLNPEGGAVRLSRGVLLRGGLAGLLASWMMGMVLAAQGQLITVAGKTPEDPRIAVWSVVILIGAAAGIAFSVMYPKPGDSAGAGVIRGAMFGFLLWAVVPISLLPLLDGSGLPWGAGQVRAVFPSLPGYVLLGAMIALLYQWLGRLWLTLFSDIVAGGDDEGVGAQGLRAVGHGVVSGLLGGLIFTGVMAQTGFFEAVASLIRASSPVTGFFVHMLIAVIVGTTYALLFRRQSYDVGSALGWGVSYGFIWWIRSRPVKWCKSTSSC